MPTSQKNILAAPLPSAFPPGLPLTVLEGRGLTLKEVTLTIPDASEVAEASKAMSRS